MNSFAVSFTQQVETFLIVVCVIAIPCFLYQAYKKYRQERHLTVQGAGASLFLAFVFYAVLKLQLLAPGLQPYVHDGERAIYTIPSLFWLNEKVELELRTDPDTGARVWMIEGAHGFYPFFQHSTYDD